MSAEAVGSVLVMASIVCGVTGIIDMMMNGARYAVWAPWGLGVAIVCLTVLGMMGAS